MGNSDSVKDKAPTEQDLPNPSKVVAPTASQMKEEKKELRELGKSRTMQIGDPESLKSEGTPGGHEPTGSKTQSSGGKPKM